jgi:hypothetical protein
VKYFKTYELVDRATYESVGDEALTLFFNPNALQALDDLREFFGSSITVNDWYWRKGGFQWRGYRTPKKAAELRSPYSQHRYGNAFDCDIKGYTAEQARHMIILNKDDILLSKIMRLEAKVTWLHFDLKPVENRIYLFNT